MPLHPLPAFSSRISFLWLIFHCQNQNQWRKRSNLRKAHTFWWTVHPSILYAAEKWNCDPSWKHTACLPLFPCCIFTWWILLFFQRVKLKYGLWLWHLINNSLLKILWSRCANLDIFSWPGRWEFSTICGSPLKLTTKTKNHLERTFDLDVQPLTSKNKNKHGNTY